MTKDWNLAHAEHFDLIQPSFLGIAVAAAKLDETQFCVCSFPGTTILGIPPNGNIREFLIRM